MNKIVAIGIDAGSTTLKIVGIDQEKNIVFKLIEDAQPLIEKQVDSLLKKLSENYDINSAKIVATGYGSNLIKADKKITEISCHAKGIYEYFKTPGTAVDIGGQDNKVILIGKNGKVIDFIMNDKCASGTGRFLENTAWRLKIPIQDMAKMALSTNKEVSISSVCAVFAESEVISHLARGKKLEEVIRGLHRAMVKRITAMINSIGLTPPLMLSGGVVKNRAVVEMLKEETGQNPLIPQDPQIMGAFGAAIFGLS
jgi:predicted CoA-substrate-specific enzyme activase